MRIYMQKAADGDKSPKFCQLILQQDLLEGWIVVKESGTQGSSGRLKREHFETREQAEQALMATRDVHVGRGYHVVFVQGTYI